MVRLAVVAGAALLACAVGLGFWTVWDARQEARAEAERTLRNLAQALEQDIARNIELYDTAALDALAGLRLPGIDQAGPELRQAALFSGLNRARYMTSVIITDKHGDIMYDAEGAVPRRANFADRDYFQVHRERTDVGLYVSRPFMSRLSGTHNIGLSRRISGKDGSFAGIVTVGVHLAYFQELFAHLDLGAHGLVTLARDDGVVLVRRPYDPAQINRDIGGNPIFQQTRLASAGLLEGAAALDGVERLYAYRHVGRSPLVLTIGLGKDEIFSPWRRKATATAAAVLGVLSLAAVLAWALRRELRRRAQAEQELERLARHLARARDEAERASRAKSRFLAGMSHELRTPLNGILGYAQLLRLEGGLSGAQSARVDAMLGAGLHLLQMINGVLDLSQVESERLDLHAAEIDLRSTAAVCLDLVRPTAVMKSLALGLAVAPDVPRCIMADPTRLRQIVLNLLGNAVKFTACGSVELRLDQVADGTALRIEVADTGPGIPADQRHRLFQEFERLGAEAAGAVEGTGLGLALSVRLAAALGGRLGHEDNPGGGSVFWLELPMTASAAEPASATLTEAPDTLPAQVRPLRVLVVDDVDMNRDIAGSFLRSAGHEVACAEGGAEAAKMAAASDFEIILMDVRMPEVDGLEATRRIRALAGPRGRVPIVALTAQAFTEQIAECRKAGMDVHLSKPFTRDALLDVVVRAVEDRTAQSMANTTPQVELPPVETARDEGASPASPPDAVLSAPAIGSALPVLDPGAFERTAALLAPQAVASYLRTLAERGEALLRGLHAPDALARTGSDLADAAHTLAGSAGMFGFERLAMVARRFERAIQTSAAEAPDLAEGLCAAIEASLQEMHSRAPASAAAPELTAGA